MEKQKVIEIPAPNFEETPRDPVLIPGGDISPEEWKRLQRETKDS